MKFSQTIAGVNFQNPIIAASGCFGFGMEYQSIFNPNILGGITLQTITKEPTGPLPIHRITEVPNGVLHATGWENPGVNFLTKTMKMSLEKNFTVPIIASIGGSNKEEYEYMVNELNNLDCLHFIELNFSCLNTPAQNLSSSEIIEIISAVKKVTKKPITIKLQPMQERFREIIFYCEENGVDALSLINNIPGMKIDTKKTKKPILGVAIGGLSGKVLHTIALSTIYSVRKYSSLPIIASGGVVSLDDALEFFMAGANLVSIGSGFFQNPLCGQEIIEALKNYLLLNNQKLEDIIGIAHK